MQREKRKVTGSGPPQKTNWEWDGLEGKQSNKKLQGLMLTEPSLLCTATLSIVASILGEAHHALLRVHRLCFRQQQQ